ncbi:hypothetical protein OROHE_013075 [Orobanche hederae]
MHNSVYMIEPPADVADYEEKQRDSEGFTIETVSPVITVAEEGELLKHSAMITRS